MTTRPNTRPAKPREDFPLFPDANGQWAKKVNQHKYYFGSWKEDREGKAALKDWLARKDSILAGLDKLRLVNTATSDWTVGRVVGEYLSARKTDMIAGTLSRPTFGDYLSELDLFARTVGEDAQIAKLTPKVFAAYNTHLIETRKLRSHARKRVIAYVKACLNWGAGNGYYPAPAYGTSFKAPNTTKEAIRLEKSRLGLTDYSKRIVTGEEIDKLLEIAPPNFRAIILLGVNCGLGPADLGRLQWKHIDMESGKLDMPRGKTGRDRHGYVWQRTREVLGRVMKLRHTKRAMEQLGPDALVFYTRKGLPFYREVDKVEGGKLVGVIVQQSISGTMGRLVDRAKLKGITEYRFRHTYKTLGKKAKDKDALNFMMGHASGETGETYDHEDISFKRVRKVSRVILRRLWPKPTRKENKSGTPSMRLVGSEAA